VEPFSSPLRAARKAFPGPRLSQLAAEVRPCPSRSVSFAASLMARSVLAPI